MSVVSALLFWLPVLGPLVAGYVGGTTAGSVTRGVLAAVLPAVLTGVLLFLAAAVLELPVIGALFGSAVILLTLAHSTVLVVGAVIGGLLA
jgi:hypothetical protein